MARSSIYNTNSFISCPVLHGSPLGEYDRVSPHFRLYEFFESETAKKLSICNYSSDSRILCNIFSLAHYVLEPIRAHVGPLKITSGYRCSAVNDAVDGVVDSYHLDGLAADIRANCSVEALYQIAKSIPNVKAIKYSTFVHVQLMI